MPSRNDGERPQEALVVANRYLRVERPLNSAVVVLVVSLFVGTYVATSLLPAVVVAAVLAVVVRAPVLESRGRFRLRTDDHPEAVREAFTGPTPPVLAFQWGVADEVTTDEGTVTYPTSYLFGLRSAEVTVHAEADTTSDGHHRVELEIAMNGRPWGTYTATVYDDDSDDDGYDDDSDDDGSGDGGEGTIVDVEYGSDRRFGLRRLPQQFAAERYRNDALAAQGYTVVERDAHFGR